MHERIIPYVREPSAETARALLRVWIKTYRQRDELVRYAKESGLSKAEIFRLTGLARSTIDDILSGSNSKSTTNNSQLLALYGSESHADGPDPC